MQKIEELIKKISKNSTKNKDGNRRKVKYQFQDIALNISSDFGLEGKDKSIMFSFIKKRLENGQWWKIKEVKEYMDSKGIKSVRYFMACFKKNERKQNERDN